MGAVDPDTLKNGNVLRMLVEQFDNEPTKQHYIAVLHCLRDSIIWIPGNIKISDVDVKAIMAANVGDTFSPQQDMRFVPDILQNGDELFLPVFSGTEQMGEYGNNFSTIERHFFDAMRLVLARKDVCGIVLDPFTAPYVARREDFDFIGSLPSMLKLDNTEKVVKFYLKKRDAEATGLLTCEGFVVCKGSKLASSPTPRCRDRIKKLREKYFTRISQDFILTEDLVFSSPSAASSFCVFGEDNGRISWKNEVGKTLKELESEV